MDMQLWSPNNFLHQNSNAECIQTVSQLVGAHDKKSQPVERKKTVSGCWCELLWATKTFGRQHGLLTEKQETH